MYNTIEYEKGGINAQHVVSSIDISGTREEISGQGAGSGVEGPRFESRYDLVNVKLALQAPT